MAESSSGPGTGPCPAGQPRRLSLRDSFPGCSKNGRADPLPFLTNSGFCSLLLLLLLVDRFLEFGPRTEFRDFPGSDLDSGARLRVTPVPGLSLGHRECAETYQSYPISFPKGSSHAVHGGINRHRSLCFTHLTSACDLINEIGFIH